MTFGPLNVPLLQQGSAAAAASNAFLNAVQPAAGSGGDDTTGLTADMLLAYCEQALKSCDTQSRDIFQTQQDDNQTITDIDSMVSALNGYTTGINVTGGTTVSGTVDDPASAFGTLVAQLQALVKEAGGPGTSLGAEIMNAVNTFTTDEQGGTDNIVSADDIASVVKDLQGAASDANSTAQLNMIKLQSIMSDRQAAIQSTTNLMQAFQDCMTDITGNIGKS